MQRLSSIAILFLRCEALWNNTERDKTYSVYALAYGIHVATTVLPIMSTIFFQMN